MKMSTGHALQSSITSPTGAWDFEGRDQVWVCAFTYIEPSSRKNYYHVTLCVALGKDFNLWNSSLKITAKICMT